MAGLCYVLAAELDRDPFLLFELRGLPREELFRKLRETPLGKALVHDLEARGELRVETVESYFTRPEPMASAGEADAEAFWQGRKRLPDALDAAAPAAVSALLVKKGGAFPEFWNQATPFPVVMETVYEAIRKRAKDW